MGKVMLKFNLPVSILQEGKKFIAYSPVLDLSTSGKSYIETKKRFSEIVDIFFEEIIQKGTLREVLQDLGWERVRAEWKPPIIISQEFQTVQLATK
jgi:hypothetical protein